MVFRRTLDSTRGAHRQLIEGTELNDARDANALVTDPRRARPVYFDGLFLTSEILTRDQNYFLTRQSDLGQLTGGGVVHGLDVSVAVAGRILEISAGHGITPSGEVVLLGDKTRIDVLDIPLQEKLRLTFGVETGWGKLARNRTGLFVVALRPVEYFSGKVATSYPTTLEGQRGREPSEIVEATALTLIPYLFETSGDDDSTARSRVATETFVNGALPRIPADALPLALVAFERGSVSWVDNALVRRIAGVDGPLGFGVHRRSVREAYVRQYAQHLADVLEQRDRDNQTASFPATEHFLTLPPVGPLPKGGLRVVNSEIEQVFFPPEVDVDLSVVPEDELVALFEEGMALPPIDLRMDDEAMENVSVIALLPVPRAQIGELKSRLFELRRRIRRSTPGHLARLRPVHALARLQRSRTPRPVVDTESLVTAEWSRLLSEATTLYYVRQRDLARTATVVARLVQPPPSEDDLSGRATRRLEEAEELARLREALADASKGVYETASEMFEGPAFTRRLIVTTAVTDMATAKENAGDPPVVSEEAAEVIRSKYADPEIGLSVDRLLESAAALDALDVRRAIASSVDITKLAGRARSLSDDQTKPFADLLVEHAEAGDQAAIIELVENGLPDEPEDPEDPDPTEEEPTITVAPSGIERVKKAGEVAIYNAIIAGAKPNDVKNFNSVLSELGTTNMVVSGLLGEAFAAALPTRRSRPTRPTLPSPGLIAQPSFTAEQIEVIRRAVLGRKIGEDVLTPLSVSTVRLAGRRWRHARVGAGLAKLVETNSRLDRVTTRRLLAFSGVLPALDQRAAGLSSRAALSKLAEALLEASEDRNDVGATIRKIQKAVRR